MRLILYTIGFVLSCIFYVLLINFPLVDSLLTLIFISSTIGFIFTREAKPEKEELLQNPKIHFYQKSRINLYGYLMVFAGAATAAIFYVATSNIAIRIGFLTLILWAILIIVSALATYYITKILFRDALYDYLVSSFDFISNYQKSRALAFALDDFFKYGEITREHLRLTLKNELREYTPEEIEDIVEVSMFYLTANAKLEEEVVSDEIKELNG